MLTALESKTSLSHKTIYRKSTDWEKVFATHTTDKGENQNLYKEHLQISKEKTETIQEGRL